MAGWTYEPIEGGHAELDPEAGCNRYRPLTAEEKRDRKRDLEAFNERAVSTLRQQRDRLLLASDWTDTPAAAIRLGAKKAAAWARYRQQLRDLPATVKDVHDPDWPKEPS